MAATDQLQFFGGAKTRKISLVIFLKFYITFLATCARRRRQWANIWPSIESTSRVGSLRLHNRNRRTDGQNVTDTLSRQR